MIQQAIVKGFVVAARSDIDQLLRELEFQRSGVTDEDVVELGRMLNVDAVLLASVNSLDVSSQRFQTAYGAESRWVASGAVSARLVSVEHGEVLWVGSGSGSQQVASRAEGPDVLPVVVETLSNGLPAIR